MYDEPAPLAPMASCSACGTACVVCAARVLETQLPALAPLLTLLLDELTVGLCYDDTPASIRPPLSPESATERESIRAVRDIAAWPAIEATLRVGLKQIRLHEIGEAAYGPINRSMPAAKRAHLTQALCQRLLERGLIVRVRRGWYALAVETNRDVSPPTVETMRRTLRSGRRLTVDQLMFDLEVSRSVVYRWLRLIRLNGEPLRWDTIPGRTHPVRRWYLEGATTVRRAA